MFQKNSFSKCLHGFFYILTQNKNKFWNINVLYTGTATHWPTPLFYWILVFHIMRKHFVLFVPKSDMTEIWLCFQIFISLYEFSVEFLDGRNSSVDWIIKIQFWNLKKKNLTIKKKTFPPSAKTKKAKQTNKNWKRK